MRAMQGCLVLDDDTTALATFRMMVRRAGHDVLAYNDPVKALEDLIAMVDNGDFLPDAVLTDQMMPGIDGMTVVRRVRELSKQSGRYCYIVVISGNDDHKMLKSGLAAGADDYLIKAIASGQLLVRLSSAKRIVELEDQQLQQQKALQQALKELRQANQIMQHDLARSGDLQREQLPPASGMINGLNYASVYEPCEVLGGDHFGLVSVDDGKTLIFLLDAAGHGVAAALLALQANRQIQRSVTQLKDHADPSQALAELAEHLNDVFQDEMVTSYFTMFCAILDTKKQRFHAVSCGHPKSYLLADNKVTAIDSDGGAIGLLPSECIT